MKRCKSRAAGVDQSISAFHQFSIELMFSAATQIIEGLLDETVAHLRVVTQLAGQCLVARTERTGCFAIQQPRRDARLAPSAIRFLTRHEHGFFIRDNAGGFNAWRDFYGVYGGGGSFLSFWVGSSPGPTNRMVRLD